jgi:hypothetical protein
VKPNDRKFLRAIRARSWRSYNPDVIVEILKEGDGTIWLEPMEIIGDECHPASRRIRVRPDTSFERFTELLMRAVEKSRLAGLPAILRQRNPLG